MLGLLGMHLPRLSAGTSGLSECLGDCSGDRHPHGETDDVIIVKVPEQRVPRTDGQWLRWPQFGGFSFSLCFQSHEGITATWSA